MFKLETIMTPGIAQLSYIVADTDVGQAVVIDPRPDVDVYLDFAAKQGLEIRSIVETHIHADFMSGSHELKDRCLRAEIFTSDEQAGDYRFDREVLHAGDTIKCGSFILTTRHTPGHSPEHISLELSEKQHPDAPWAVFTGDSLFVGSAGRPDLMGDKAKTKQLVKQLHQTLYEYYLSLDDGMIILPCHGAGSACGADIGDRPFSTIGYERMFNPFLQHPDFNAFEHFVLDDPPPQPSHYARLKKVNGKGPQVLHGVPKVPGMTPDRFAKAVNKNGAQLIDTRHMLGFGAGHIDGALNIGNEPQLSVWAGQMLDASKDVYLVCENDTQVQQIAAMLIRVGITRIKGYLSGGMTAWQEAGKPMRRIEQMDVHDVCAAIATNTLSVLDVRKPDESRKGHIPTAQHHHLGELKDEQLHVDPHRPLAVYCGSGYRSSIAASLLQNRGFKDIRNIPGSFKAWKAAGFEIDIPQGAKS